MKPSLFLPLLLIIGGALWLLSSLDMLPGLPATLSILLCGIGGMILFFDGINKQSVVASPLLFYVGGAIYADSVYDFERLTPMIALGMILLGCLLLLARSSHIPEKTAKK